MISKKSVPTELLSRGSRVRVTPDAPYEINNGKTFLIVLPFYVAILFKYVTILSAAFFYFIKIFQRYWRLACRILPTGEYNSLSVQFACAQHDS